MSERFRLSSCSSSKRGAVAHAYAAGMYELLGSFGLPAFEDVVRAKAPTSSDSSTDRGAGTPEYETDLAAWADAQAQALRSDAMPISTP